MTWLETERLVIRNFHISDWEALHEMITQYESSELAAYDQPWPTAPEEIKKITEWFASGDSYLAVCLKATGRFIGFVALTHEPADDQREFNLGYIFNSEYHGHGYATEACRAVLGHAFDSRQAHRVVTGTAEANSASCRFLERLGFQKTSERTSSFRQTSDGTPIPFVAYTFELSRDAWKVVDQHSSG
ncbi:MAG TPA: GNAT family N-acetyltransferase [Pyrinomonadaceae bacterium]|nr:GNAT family N-acetyltransferase [Pyrinomonadaceae bacterium]